MKIFLPTFWRNILTNVFGILIHDHIMINKFNIVKNLRKIYNYNLLTEKERGKRDILYISSEKIAKIEQVFMILKIQ